MIDQLIEKQINGILHHETFRKCEASWRGLHALVNDIPKTARRLVQVKLLCLPESDLRRDLENANEVEQTALFKKIYVAEYDQAGGLPFGLLLADYEVSLQGECDWISSLSMLNKIAAAAFAPLLLSPKADFFELSSYTELTDDIDLERSFSQQRYARWQRLRQQEDSRFLYMVLPRVLWRVPYQYHERYLANHGFREQLASLEDYCWGSPIYLIAMMITRCFIETGWFTHLRSASIELPFLYANCDSLQQHPIGRVEACISEKLEQDLSVQGFTALTEIPTVYALSLRSCHSIQIPAHYHDDLSNMNAEVATMLPYLLCASRFAHYIKVLAREKIGSFLEASACQQYLQRWIFNYCGKAQVDNAQQIARYPLSDARITVNSAPGQPGKLLCKMELKPNYHIEKINTKLRFISLLQAN